MPAHAKDASLSPQLDQTILINKNRKGEFGNPSAGDIRTRFSTHAFVWDSFLPTCDRCFTLLSLQKDRILQGIHLHKESAV